MSGGMHDSTLDTGSAEPQSLPLLSDFGAAQEMSSNVGRSNKNRRVMVAALIILGAAGGIFVMRQVGLGAASVIASIVVDYDPNEFKKGASDPAVLEELARGRMAVQVPAEVIEHDPFRLDAPRTEVAAVEAPRAVVSPEEQARLQRERRVKEAAGKVEVQSVMGGPIPLARINGTMVRLGDSVLDVLKVESIQGRSVVLRGDDFRFGYTMGEPGIAWTRSVREGVGGP